MTDGGEFFPFSFFFKLRAAVIRLFSKKHKKSYVFYPSGLEIGRGFCYNININKNLGIECLTVT